MNKQLPRFNLVNERGDYLAYNFTKFTVRKEDSWWGIATAVVALKKEFPQFKNLIQISVNETPAKIIPHPGEKKRPKASKPRARNMKHNPITGEV